MQLRTSTTLLVGLEDPHNDAAWRRFYAGYKPMLLSYARRVGLSDADAQDVVAATMNTFVSAYRAGRYDRQRARLKSWLGGIVRNKVLALLAKRREASLDVATSDGAGRSLEPVAPDDRDELFEREWQLEMLNCGLGVLRRESDPNTYQAFDLYAVKGWPVAKVASFLKMSTNAVYIAKTRMLQRLREIVRELSADEE